MPEPSAGSRVLVVEDDIELGAHLCAYLESRGLEVMLAASLLEAQHVLASDRELDLLITDIYLERAPSGALPGGLVLAEVCDARRPRIPVILLTGQPSMDAALGGLRQHAFDLLTKPVSLPELHRRAVEAIEKRSLLQQLAEAEEENDILSRILPNTIEAKDPSTRGHSDRVAGYAENLGRQCGLDEGELRDLRLAAMLHDVGKIGVPEAILTKPGPLTAAERSEIQKHPEIGFKILEPLDHLPRVRSWVYEHHERWDGLGYPRGLVGEEVALPGRILIVAEVFDALATARSYKRAWPRVKIADFFEADAGKRFDPELATVVAEGVRVHGVDYFRTRPGENGRGPQLF